MEIRKITIDDIPEDNRSLFQSKAYLTLFFRIFSKADNLLILGAYDQLKLVAVLPFEKQENSLIFLGMQKILGGQEITDYGDILTFESLDYEKLWNAVFSYVRNISVSLISLDYVRRDSLIYTYFSGLNNGAIEQQEVAPFISLPSSWETYLDSLDRTNRKELKRKLKRLDSVSHTFVVHSSNDKNAFNDFILLHRKSNNSKRAFMSDKMEYFFSELSQLPIPTWDKQIALLHIDNRPVAAILFFENTTNTLLYNSGFDPQYRYYSVGLMLHAFLIKRGIEMHKITHDFLRGSERYKYELGAVNMNLYKITISL